MLLVERGLVESRSRAQALVMEGKVRVDGQVELKSSRKLEDTASVEVETPPRFVSRGGEKLAGAFDLWGAGNAEFAASGRPVLSAEGRTCLDVGSSTGGFTDCLLQNGAARVMAVDVGTNQLAYKLRSDPRVWVRENYNARYMTAADLPWTPEVAVTDVSFISLRLILPPIRDVLAPGGLVVALIKPQFEVGRGEVGRGGIVKNEKARLRAVETLREKARAHGLCMEKVVPSPLTGGDGNVEYLALFHRVKEENR